MKKLHAVGAGIIGVALSATAALAAAPLVLPSSPTVTTDENASTGDHGAAVSTVAKDHTLVGGKHNNHGGAVSTVARAAHGPESDETTTEDETAPDADTTETPKTNHGAAVSAVAKDETQVGGKNNNHGGAVSAAAHGTHGPNSHANKHANENNANEHANEHANKH
jgi:hypothetical protein